MQTKSKPNSISVLIPVLNGHATIKKCLSSIYAQNYPKNLLEVIIVDNHSTDDTTTIIAQEFPQARLIKLKSNVGSAPALTQAARAAHGLYVLATNDDVVFAKNCFRTLLNTINLYPNAGIATGKMFFSGKKHRLAIPGFRINHYLGYQPYDLGHSDEIRECDYAPGACIFMRRGLLRALGYFDDAYIFCGEDYDICFQMQKAGFKIIYNPQAIFFHSFHRNATRVEKSVDSLFPHYRGKIRYILKNLPLHQQLVALFFQITLGPLYTFLFFHNATYIPLLKALAWNWQNFPQTHNARLKAIATCNKLRLYNTNK